MAEHKANDVLRRKARESGQTQTHRSTTAAKVLGNALPKLAHDVFGLMLSVVDVATEEFARADLGAALPEGGLLVLLDGPGGAVGAAALDSSALTAIIEMQTIGQVMTHPGVARQATRVDAAIVQPLIDGLLEILASGMGEGADGHWAGGYRFGAWVEDKPGLFFALGAEMFHLLRADLDLAFGAKSGQMVLVLPDLPPPVVAARDSANEAKLADAVLEAPADVTAVLARIALPLSQIKALHRGQVLPIPGDSLGDARLEMRGGAKLSAVKLGQLNGFRAVRLRDGPAHPSAALSGAQVATDPGLPSSAATPRVARHADAQPRAAAVAAQHADVAPMAHTPQIVSEGQAGAEPDASGAVDWDSLAAAAAAPDETAFSEDGATGEATDGFG